MRMIDAETVRRLLPWDVLMDGLEAGHRAEPARADALLMQDGATSFLTLPAWRPGGAMGVKIATVFPENPAAGKPAVQAAYVLFDGADGTPAAAIDGTALTYAKTAADSGLGARLLAREEARVMLMVGAGGLCAHVIGAMRAARPSIAEVMIWNRTPERAEAQARALRRAGVAAEAVGDLEAGARRADVISCATNATEPLIRGAWLKPGAHLDLIGSYAEGMREADDEALARGSLFGDGRARVFEDSGEMIHALASGAIRAADFIGDFTDLARGACRRRVSDDEITVFKNAGGGHLDLMTAELLMSRLKTEEAGG